MKKLLILIILSVCLLFPVFGKGRDETSETEEPLILWLGLSTVLALDHVPIEELEGIPYLPGTNLFSGWFTHWVKRETGHYLDIMGVARADGTTKEIDLYLAADGKVDVYMDYMGRTSKLGKYAVDLSKHYTKKELADFIPSYVEPLWQDGKLTALPNVSWTTCLAVNKTIVEEAGVGHLLPANDDPDRSWTYDEFLKVCKAVKALDKGYTGFYIHAGAPGGDYFVTGMIFGFGAKHYANGEIAINTPEGIRALKFLKMLADEGYAPPGCAGLTDYDAYVKWISNKCAMQGGSLSEVHSSVATKMVTDGITDVAPELIVMEYPHDPAICSHTPVAVGPMTVMAFDSPMSDEAVKLVKFLTGTKYQTWAANGSMPSRYSVEVWPTVSNMEPNYIQILELLRSNGSFDHGLGFANYMDLRILWNATLQGILAGSTTVEDALENFETEGNIILGK